MWWWRWWGNDETAVGDQLQGKHSTSTLAISIVVALPNNYFLFYDLRCSVLFYSPETYYFGAGGVFFVATEPLLFPISVLKHLAGGN